jgi:hypothetical protein
MPVIYEEVKDGDCANSKGDNRRRHSTTLKCDRPLTVLLQDSPLTVLDLTCYTKPTVSFSEHFGGHSGDSMESL